MRWVTRSGVHVDRASCAWLIRKAIDPPAEFVFTSDLGDAPVDAIGFDMPGVPLTHHGEDCTFETMLRHYELQDPVLWKMAQIIHEADLDDEQYDAPEARGLDAIIRGLSMTLPDHEVLAASAPIFDGLYEYFKRSIILGREST